MKMKKLLSGAMAAALSLSLAVPAFATNTVLNGVEGLAEGATVEVTGTTQTATVKVTVPSGGNVVLNPYELKYTVDGADVTDQIISAEQYIVSESNLPIKVSTSVTGTIEGTGDFMATTAVGETDKKVNLKFEIGATSAADTAAASYDSKPLVKGTAVTFDPITMTDKDGATPAVAFKFTGDAAKNPTNPWTTEDVVGASIAFTFALDNSGGSTPPASGDHNITEGAHVGNPTSVTFKVGGTAVTKAAKGATVTIEVAAGTGKTVTAKVNGGSDITFTESTGTYTGTFTMPDADAEVIVTVV